MKRLLIVSIMVVGITSLAFAQPAPKEKPAGPGYHGYGYGHGCCCCMPCDMGPGKGPMGKDPKGKPDPLKNAPESTVKSAKDAKKAVEKYVKENFKGYKVGKVKEFEGRRGPAYSVDATDAGGNKAEFHVNPWGKVIGPIFVR